MNQSFGEALFVYYWRALALYAPMPATEYRFHPVRKWKFDFAWPRVKVAVEIEGGAFSKGRHTRGKGFEGDCEKYNAALDAGWRVYRFTPGMLKYSPSECIAQVVEAISRYADCDEIRP